MALDTANTGASTAGVKHDAGKAPWELLPWDAVEQVVRVLQFGANKYAARNWEKGIAYSRLFGAMQRHGKSWFQDREELDPETGLHHLAHLTCETLFALAHVLRGTPNLDDRPVARDTLPPEAEPTEVEVEIVEQQYTPIGGVELVVEYQGHMLGDRVCVVSLGSAQFLNDDEYILGEVIGWCGIFVGLDSGDLGLLFLVKLDGCDDL